MIPLVYPLALGVLGLGAWWKKTGRNKKPKGLTAERELLYNNAMTDERDPAKLRKLADLFASDPTLRAQADLLRKRAALADAPADIKEARREAFRKGMRATDPDKIEDLAEAYEKCGALGSAKALRLYAKGLRLTDVLEIEKLAAQLDKGDNEKVGAESLRARIQQLNAEHVEHEPAEDVKPPPEAIKSETIPAPPPAAE